MTQEEKQLLLKDLCARIPYHTLVQLNPGAYNKPETCLLTGADDEKVYLNIDSDPFSINNIKPYLRPMSSMTGEETEEYKQFLEDIEGYAYSIDCVPQIDWLNEHHFDYRGLIKKGLAIKAPESLYKTE